MVTGSIGYRCAVYKQGKQQVQSVVIHVCLNSTDICVLGSLVNMPCTLDVQPQLNTSHFVALSVCKIVPNGIT